MHAPRAGLISSTVLAALGVLAVAGPAWAGDATTDFNRGVELMNEGKVREAVDIWVTVVDRIDAQYLPKVHKALGKAYRKLDELPEAFYHLSRYQALAAKRSKKIRGALRKIVKKLRKSHAPVAFQCTPEGAKVHPGGTPESPGYPCPETWWLSVGTHKIYAEGKGYKSASYMMKVAEPNEEATLEVKLEALPTTGVLVVAGKAEGAEVLIGGVSRGKVPMERELPATSYIVTLRMEGKKDWSETVKVIAGERVTIEPEMEDAAPAPPPAKKDGE